MFAQVLLLSGWREPLWYKIPLTLIDKIKVGSFVEVPLRTQKIPALVKRIELDPALPFKEIKEIAHFFPLPGDELYHGFINKIADFFFINPTNLHHRIVGHLQASPEDTEDEIAKPSQSCEKITLSDEQQLALDTILPSLENQSNQSFLLHGVTGSGKTEIYKKLIEKNFELKKSTLCLFPEVTLALQFEAIFKSQLSCASSVFSFHSSTKVSDKKMLWQQLLTNKQVIIIGVHLPVLLPISNLGLIIIDEEHERGFQEKRHPKINSKEMALWRAQIYQCPIVLGSATPSLSTLQRVENNQIIKCTLNKRFKGKFPTIIKASLKENSRKRGSFWITRELELAIKKRLENKEQIILYLNRRGYSFSAQCNECGNFVNCTECSVTLTPHEKNIDSFYLSCHYCGFSCPVPTICPTCKKSEKPLLMKGIGTQQLATIIKKMFPAASIARADLDSTKKKREWLEQARQFKNGEIDILIGTQLITKGYHFPKVTLVGVIWADLGLSIPDYHTRETVLQKLIQVAGRAGREHESSEVIIQSMSDDELFSYISEERYPDFCIKELEARRELSYPPFGRLVQIEFINKNELKLNHEISMYKNMLQKVIQENNLPIRQLGPVEPIIKKIAGIETRHLFLRCATYNHIQKLIHHCPWPKSFSSSIFVTPS